MHSRPSAAGRSSKCSRTTTPSAFSGKKRPAYERMLDAVQSGRIDGIVAWHPDRLHRSPRELEDFIDLLEATGCGVGTVQAGDYNLSTATGRQNARIVGVVARGESEHKSDRIRRKLLQNAQEGNSMVERRRPALTGSHWTPSQPLTSAQPQTCSWLAARSSPSSATERGGVHQHNRRCVERCHLSGQC